MILNPIKNGWAALGDGWAVHGKTKEEAAKLYHEAVARHKEIAARSSTGGRVARFASILRGEDSGRPDKP